MSNRKTGLGQIFGNLKVRPKLMVLHNLFFLVLTCTAYFSLIPLYEQLLTDSRTHNVIAREGSRGPQTSAPVNQQARQTYSNELRQARIRLFLVLGIIYLLAVLVLESAIMPLYVYRPLRRMLRRTRRRKPATANAN